MLETATGKTGTVRDGVGRLRSRHSFYACLINMQVPSKTIPLFIQLPGRNTTVLLRAPCENVQYVGDLIKAAIAEFSRLNGFKAEELLLFKIDGSSRTLLDGRQTLSEAGVNAGTTLSVELLGGTRTGL